MRPSTRHLIVSVLVTLLGCSDPDGKSGLDETFRDAGDAGDAGYNLDAESAADAESDLDDTGLDGADFEFGFDPELITFVLSGPQQATIQWDGRERTARFFLFEEKAEVLGTLSFEVDTQRITFRLRGTIDVLGEISMTLTERTCNGEGDACDDVPAELQKMSVYETVGRFDGSQVVFAPLQIRPEAMSVDTSFAFQPPTDIVMVPNDGFKPAMVPDPAGKWEGEVSFLPPGGALTGETTCSVEIEEDGTGFRLASMSCDGQSFTLGSDPGPDPSTLQLDTTSYFISFDFVDGTRRFTFGGEVGEDAFTGVIIEAGRFDDLTSPGDASLADVDGVFFLHKTLF